MREKRDEILILRITKSEKSRIYEKMLGMGIRSLSAYIRKMALDGYCLHLDLQELRRMAYLLQMCSTNLNQYAKRANECGQVYTLFRGEWMQFLILLVAEFGCFVLVFAGTAVVDAAEMFSGWLAGLGGSNE